MVKGLGVGEEGLETEHISGNGQYVQEDGGSRQCEKKPGKSPEKEVIYNVVRGRKEGRGRIRKKDSERGGEDE